MTPTWIIAELERQRRERVRREQPQLRIEPDVPQADRRGPRPPPVVRIVIELGPRSRYAQTLVL